MSAAVASAQHLPPSAAAVGLPADVVERLAATPQPRRQEMLRALVELLLADAANAPEDVMAVFDTVLLPLIERAEVAQRAEAARRIARAPRGPRATLRHFATDVIEVADPVLRHARGLTEQDLIAVARNLTEAHRIAVGNRRALPELVSEALVARGEANVLRTLAANRTAKLSDTARSILVGRAVDDEQLQVLLVARTDLPEGIRDEIVNSATRTAKERLEALGFVDESDRILAEAMAGALAVPNPLLDIAPAQREVLESVRAQKLDEILVLERARRGDTAVVVCAVAAMARLEPRLVEAIVRGERADPVLLLCRSMGFEVGTLEAILHLSDGRRRTREEILKFLAQYRRTTPEAAKRVVKVLKLRAAIKA